MKLNLGCGSKILDGFTNVDKYNSYKPDIIHDLEIFPYPFDDNSVDEIILSHVLEHIGQVPDIFNNIIKELYRICKNDTLIKIAVPHPRHDDFISDPTHVRPITVLGLSLYDKELNKIWEKNNAANSPLGIIHNVNFKIVKANYVIDDKYKKLLAEKKILETDLEEHSNKYNNVIKEIQIDWKVVK
jgi:ubiquinone/menaquinone biosynthesis C-methylase UbiE